MGTEKEQAREMCGPKILIIEDDRTIRETLTSLLEDEGYRIESAENGRRALDLLGISMEVPSVILLDLMMPVMNGWQFYVELKKNEQLPSIPIIVLSADRHVSEKAASIPAVGLLTKPFDFEKLLESVQSAIGGAA